MKLNAGRLAIALGGATAIFWIVCSGLVVLFSSSTATMTGHMLHMDGTAFAWTMTFPGFISGLILWTICAALFGWLIGWIYNSTGGSNAAS